MANALTLKEKRDSLKSLLIQNEEDLRNALPQYLDPKQMIRAVLTACTKTPKLLECSRTSVAIAVLNACECGLPVDGYHAHLIPYGKDAVFVPDYKGLVALAHGCGITVHADVVYEADEFLDERGLEPKLVHRPFMSMRPAEKEERRKKANEGRGEMIAAYAVATLPDGRKVITVMYADEIRKVQAVSKSSSSPSSPWQRWPDTMWIKTVVKRLLKMVPRDRRMTAAMMRDDEAEIGQVNVGQDVDLRMGTLYPPQNDDATEAAAPEPELEAEPQPS